jgi:hypothetical protein
MEHKLFKKRELYPSLNKQFYHERREDVWKSAGVSQRSLNLMPEGTTGQLPSPCRFTPVKRDSRLGSPKSQNVHCEEEKNLFLVREMNSDSL